jgi:AcrR family transcriptional regulator
MRRRILDATVVCLQEYGYAGTTIGQVVAKAGITRGALAHHFAAKSELVATAVGYIAATRTTELIARGQHARDAEDPIDAGLELLWSAHQGPMFVAVAELWVAARTDPELQRRIAYMEQATNAIVVELAKALFGPAGADPEVRNLVYTAMDVVRGILMAKIAMPRSNDEHEARWRRAKESLRMLFEHALAQQAPTL